MALRRAAHKALDQVGRNIEALRFNVAVAQLYELSNVLSEAFGKSGDGLAWAQREATEVLVQLLGPMMPHLGEECWTRLGYNTLLAEQCWPEPEASLLVDDTVVIAVQLNGKRRDELTVSRTASNAEVEAAVLRLTSVVRALEGRTPKKVIVVPNRIVNVVA
jgi:leucyl-tRNA synthetase